MNRTPFKKVLQSLTYLWYPFLDYSFEALGTWLHIFGPR